MAAMNAKGNTKAPKVNAAETGKVEDKDKNH